MPSCCEGDQCKFKELLIDGCHVCALCRKEMHGICGHFYNEGSIRWQNICTCCKDVLDQKKQFHEAHNLPALPFPMTEKDIDELLPEISRGRDGLLVIVPLQEQQKRPPTKMKTIIPVPLVSKKGGVKKPKMTAATTAKETASTSAPEPASTTAATTAEKTASTSTPEPSSTTAALVVAEKPASTAAAESATTETSGSTVQPKVTPTALTFDNMLATTVNSGGSNAQAVTLRCSYKKCVNKSLTTEQITCAVQS